MIFHVGCGTLEVVVEDFRFSTSGDTKPDGIDMDKVLSDYIILEFKKQSGLDEKSNRQDK